VKAPKRLKLRIPEPPEDSLHKSVADLLDAHLLLPATWTTFPAGLYVLNPAAAGRLKRLGLKAGMPDILVFWHGCVGIELKRDSGTRQREQKFMHLRLEAAGIPVYVCRSLEAVADALVRHDVPLRASVVRALLDRPYRPAERAIDVGETVNGKHTGTEASGAAQPAQGALPA